MIGKELMKNNSERLDYNFIFKPLKPTVYYDDGYTYSMAQLELRFSRTEKSRNQIFGGYYAGTLTFASLSLVSFFIHPDMVPGRMGMLIMLYLIQVNTYGSLDAPPKRGFSSIEVKLNQTRKSKLTRWHFQSIYKEVIWPRKFLTYMHGLKIAIFGNFSEGWAVPSKMRHSM